MNVRDWTSYLEKGPRRILRLAQLSADLTQAVGAASDIVHLDHLYARKFMLEHQLLPQHFPMLDTTIDRGMVLRDGDQHLVFFYFDAHVFNRWFRVTVKRCKAERRLWLSTFHKTTWGQVKGKRKRLEMLRDLKD
jgi:hypothetical protein